MSHALPLLRTRDRLTSYFRSGEVMGSRSVSGVVLSGVIAVPAPSARLMADWEREISLQLGLEPGDVEPLPLPRARARWPDYAHCVQSALDWTRTLGLREVIANSDIALMACRGARYHHDGAQYGGAAFCNLFISEDKGLDLHFPVTGHRIPLVRGTALVFDTGQPHAVVRRGGDSFDVADFAPDQDCTQVFLTWELPIENVDVARSLGVEFDVDPATAARIDEEQVWWNGAPMTLCSESGGLE
ncbi:hypothetical protein BH11PSE13_BH11PSE13_27600 [soil metagenome]